MFGENLCENLAGVSEGGVLLPLALSDKINRSQLETRDLRIRLHFFYSSTQMDMSNKN